MDFPKGPYFYCRVVSIVNGFYCVHICCVCIVKTIATNVFLRLILYIKKKKNCNLILTIAYRTCTEAVVKV